MSSLKVKAGASHFAAFCLVLVSSVSAGLAQDVSLAGEWSGETIVLVQTDKGPVQARTTRTLVFQPHDGRLLRGHMSWKSLDGVSGHVGNESVVEAQEPFIGVLEHDNTTVRLVEAEDSGICAGRLLSANELQITHVEPAPFALVWTGILIRSGD
jgi:hypothetical protein